MPGATSSGRTYATPRTPATSTSNGKDTMGVNPSASVAYASRSATDDSQGRGEPVMVSVPATVRHSTVTGSIDP
ncbi:hypothetical protein [Mariniluteicoccus flavus]